MPSFIKLGEMIPIFAIIRLILRNQFKTSPQELLLAAPATVSATGMFIPST